MKTPLYCRHCFEQMATLRLVDQNKTNEHHEYWCDDCVGYTEGLTTIQIADAINLFETTGFYDHSGRSLGSPLPTYESMILKGSK